MLAPGTERYRRAALLLGRQYRVIECTRCDCRTSGIEPRPGQPPPCWHCGLDDKVRPV